MAEVPNPDPKAGEGQGLGVHEHCVTDRPTPDGQIPSGEFIKLGDVNTYVSKPSSYPQKPARFLLFLTGGTGVGSINNQLQADRFAAEGNFLVVMPDMFYNDPAPNTAMIPDSEDRTALDTVRLRAVEIGKSFMIDMWLARHTEQRAMPVLYRVLEACADEYADAIAYGGGVYSVGYCIGGRYVLLLGAERQDPAWGWGKGTTRQARAGDEEAPPPPGGAGGPLIKVGAVAHAAQVVPADFATLKIPLTMVCVESDPLFSDEVRKAGEDAMSAAGLEHEVQVYPGVPHGFAVVGSYMDEHIKEAQATAHEQMLKWLTEH